MVWERWSLGKASLVCSSFLANGPPGKRGRGEDAITSDADVDAAGVGRAMIAVRVAFESEVTAPLAE